MLSSTTGTLAAPASSQEAHDATAVKPAADVSVPTTPASDKDAEKEVEKPVQEEGWDFFSYILFIAVVAAIGFALWWMGAPQALKRYWTSQAGRGKYKRVDDVEK